MSFRGITRIALVSGVICLGVHLYRGNSIPVASAAGDAGVPATPVVVELFTSEGCSDCPPADALLSRLGKTQPVPGANIIILEEHVDYWDRLGWKDPFSSALVTKRQADYADAYGGRQVYTPQMIVDGQAQFVGSSASTANMTVIAAASSHKPSVNLQWTADGKLKVEIQPLTGVVSGQKSDVILAVTENALHSNVNRGENAGRALEHNGVVRQFQVVGKIEGNAQAFSSTVTVQPQRDWNRANLNAVIFVQGQKDMHVAAAGLIPFPTS